VGLVGVIGEGAKDVVECYRGVVDGRWEEVVWWGEAVVQGDDGGGREEGGEE
jgi:hypothetical protein